MSMKRLIAVGAAGLLAAACGGEDSGGINNNPDAGHNNINPDGGNNTGNPALTINAALGLYLVQAPASDEGAVTGLVMLENADGETVSGASVKINGVTLPEDPVLTGFYDASKVQISDTGPDKTLTVAATSGSDTASVVFKCPAEVTLTAPAENSAVSAGQNVTLSWTGKIDYNPAITLVQATAAVYGWDSAANTVTQTMDGENTKNVPSGTSVQLTVPTTSESGYVAQLDVPGTFTMENGNAGYCALRRRVHLTKQ